MIQPTDKEDIEVVVDTITTTQEKDLQDVLYVTKLIIYVLNSPSKTKMTSYFVRSVEWVIII